MKRVISNTLILSILIMLVFTSMLYQYLEKLSICDLRESDMSLEVGKIETSKNQYSLTEKTIPAIPSEGTGVKIYKNNEDEVVLVEQDSFGATFHLSRKYYLKHEALFLVMDNYEQWDMKKLYGEFAEKDLSEGEYVVGATTSAKYVIHENKICDINISHNKSDSGIVYGSYEQSTIEDIGESLEWLLKSGQ